MAADDASVLVPLAAELTLSIGTVLDETATALRGVDPLRLDRFTAELVSANRLFFAGEGRSGLVARMAAMRLVHLGLRVHVVGEATAPAISRGDRLIVVSGSGGTGVLSHLADRATAAGGRVMLVTAALDSPLGRAADAVVAIPAPTKTDQTGLASAQFAGSLFEQTALLLFDSIFHTLTRTLGKDAEQMWSLHTNLE